MPTSLPRSVREHLGDQVADDLSRWFTENIQQELVTNDEYREVLSRLDVLEDRFDHVEERFDHVDERLNRMKERFGNRFEEVNQRFEGIDRKLDRMNYRILSMTRWIIGLIALFGTMVTVLLAVAQFGS